MSLQTVPSPFAPPHSGAFSNKQRFKIVPMFQLPIKYQWVSHLTPANSIQFDAFTFPSLAKRWQVFQQRGSLCGIAALQAGQMVGLVIAESLFQTSTIDVLSLFVSPAHRQQGIGTTLLRLLEKAALKLNCAQLQVRYQATDIAQVALESIVTKLGWSTPAMDFLLVESTTEHVKQAPWLHKYPLPAAFTIFPWTELTTCEADLLRQRQDYPTVFSPFSDDPRLEPLTSLGLRYQSRIVGWMITHRVAPDTIRYSTMYVEPQFQKLGRGVSLFAEALKQHIDSPIRKGKYAVAKENVSMIHFVRRHAKPYLTVLTESRYASKSLATLG